MKLRPCPFCNKPIPSRMDVCPYCHRDEKGEPVAMDTAAPPIDNNPKLFEQDFAALSSEDPFVREQATVRLAQHGFGITQSLISILSDHAKPGLSGVAKVLGRIGDKRAIPVLAQAAKRGDEDLRMAALWALAQYREPEALPVLMSEAERVHPVTQSFLVYVLGTFQDPQLIPLFSRLAVHGGREAAFQAAFALGDLADPRSLKALRRARRRRDPLVRAAVLSSLQKLGVSPAAVWGWETFLFWGGVVALVLGGAAWWFYR